MATFHPVVRTSKEQNAVYIRINHSSKTDYIKTEMIVHKSGIRKGEIVDSLIKSKCAIIIRSYIEKINSTNIDGWTIQEIKEYLMNKTEGISFSDYSRKYIDKMIVSGRSKPAGNYSTALNSLEKHYGRKIFFSDITAKELRKWIECMESTSRAKNMYPIIIKKLFEEGCLEYNDYDRDVIKITNQPFRAVKIPKSNAPTKRFIEVETLKKIFETDPMSPREEFALDISRIVFYLVGINTVDLYDLSKSELKGCKLCYTRKKTEKERMDKAYIEIMIPKEILLLLEKYKGEKRLFNFSEKYSDPDCFSTAVNKGLKSLCERSNIKKVTVYWFRHTWATIAQNKCGASTEQVAFCLNHTSAHRVTEGYIEKDFSPIDELNRKVIDYVFAFNSAPG